MSITIHLSPEIEEALQADALSQGRDAALIAAELIAARYAVAKNEAETSADDADLRAALRAPAHPFNPDALRRKYGLPLG